jgi:hypothetical protein
LFKPHALLLLSIDDNVSSKVGEQPVMRQNFIVMLWVAAAPLFSGCEQASPSSEAAESEAGGVVTFVEKDWRYLEDASYASALSYPSEKTAQLFVGCQSKSISFHFSGLKPRRTPPRSALVVTLAKGIVLSKQPDASMRKDGKGFGAKFSIDAQVLNGLRSSEGVVARYGDAELHFPAPPARMRALLADKCAETM